MKIKIESHYVDIFGIYWAKSLNTNTIGTYLCALPLGNGGMTVFCIDHENKNNKNNIEIIDSKINWSSIYYHNSNIQGIYHHSLIEENLLDDILEYDKDAYERFLEIIKEEGLVDSEFY
ncbi:hypothetical protein A9G29_11535 [Gilliamella sp. Fer2-1]|jgi:hypothetical protein|uniref:hypothetical protein n=1 Tax=unclassified Gilliamella TaxID=2685620 RepID=UPI00080E6703|nr:hypothetical protein [Gilliamella apicola]OCG37245.1 hypothetical protein A9G29_11535 [Gilliamella apicola]OCG59653.1 hypothetical protein A9G40_00260 [Gilliamella apicola]OCG68115.1 hypothetical protein A9G41_08930 [Gilliamella apicola]